MPEKITVNVIAATDSTTSVAIGSMTLLSSLIQELTNQGVLTEDAVRDIYDRAIDALAAVDAKDSTEQQRLSSQAAAFLRGLAAKD